MFRLGERVRLELDPPYASAFVEVDSVVSQVIAARAAGLFAAFDAAEGTAEAPALLALYEFVVAEARPAWDLVDHRGPVATTAGGFLRLPTALGLGIVDAWLDTLNAREPIDEAAAAGPTGGALTPGPSDAALAAARRPRRKVTPDAG